MAVLNLLLILLVLVVAVPVLVLLVQAAAALLLGRGVSGELTGKERANSGASVAVLIPAHNEGAGLLPTIGDLRPQLGPQDRILVVADNCSDDTAEQAAKAGAEVIVRHDPAKRGKGFALDFGMRHLAASPPDILVMCDADCRIGPDAVAQLVGACLRTGRPTQALYLMDPPQDRPGEGRVSQFAWRLRNKTRPLGMLAMGQPCQLMGTGMAFPWNVIRTADLATARLAEDLELGIELARDGHPPLFCPAASVTSEFAATNSGADTQRERWQRGHLNAIRKQVPGLLLAGLRKRDPRLITMALDVAVPPIVMLTGATLAVFAVCAVFALLTWSAAPALAGSALLLALLVALFLYWIDVGRDILPLGKAAGAFARYSAKAVPFAGHILASKGTAGWVRTDRTKPPT
jgi:cellulose synthase/poly-beta-1,6-N-acetylglucosamine synthase-like glycosyltransferase